MKMPKGSFAMQRSYKNRDILQVTGVVTWSDGRVIAVETLCHCMRRGCQTNPHMNDIQYYLPNTFSGEAGELVRALIAGLP